MEKTLKILPLGGCGEIGMNMTVLQVDDQFYFIDCGLLFPDQGMPGVDLILPDVSVLLEHNIRPTAWLITHGHEDHIGALPYWYPKFPAPIYASDFTRELIKGKFAEAGIENAQFRPWVPLQTTPFRNIKVTPYIVNHSIAHALGFFIETKHGNVLHTGDFRIDSNPPEGSKTHENLEKAVAGKPVRIMLSDSTNSFQVGTDKSENDLVAGFEQVMEETSGVVVIATFASNIWRYQSAFDAAQKYGRKIFFLGRSLKKNFEIAEMLNLLHYEKDLIVNEDEFYRLPRNELCIVCTGSQGEQFSGASRLAFNMLEKFKLDDFDSVVFSARAIPGNEKSIGLLINQFSRLGCRIVTAKELDVHVSGHGYQEDLMTCIRIAKPECFMPVHGEYRHLRKHIELAEKVGVKPENCYLAENGDVVVAGPKPYGVVERVQSGRDYVCQGTVLSSDSDVYKTRLSLAKNGFFVVSYVMAHKGFTLAAKPVCLNKGVPVDYQKIESQLEAIFESSAAHCKGRKDFNDDTLADDLRLQVRRAIEQRAGYKCMVNILLQRIG